MKKFYCGFYDPAGSKGARRAYNARTPEHAAVLFANDNAYDSPFARVFVRDMDTDDLFIVECNSVVSFYATEVEHCDEDVQ